MSDSLAHIPVIDFRPFLEGDLAARQVVAAEIYRACHGIGFLYLSNHGIAQPLIERLFAQSQQFFELPVAVKQRAAWSGALSNRGYVGLGRERLDPSQPGDPKEAFNLGRELSPELTSSLGSSASLGLNHWPSELPAFRQTVLEFYTACAQAALRVLQAFALALRLPERFFEQTHTPGDHTLRLLHYPPELEPGRVRAGAHSDYGSLTLLLQDQVGGLEVRSLEGQWLPAPTLADTLVVNTGDLLERWTNHEFVSTQHRVVGLTGSAAAIARHSRYSVAFFCHPNPETEVACLETCHGSERPALYPPIRSGEYLLSRLRATY